MRLGYGIVLLFFRLLNLLALIQATPVSSLSLPNQTVYFKLSIQKACSYLIFIILAGRHFLPSSVTTSDVLL